MYKRLAPKKSQGMPLNVIVIAAILLVVLVIFISFFKTNISKISGDLQRCEVRGGECVDKKCDGRVLSGFKCDNDNLKCCLKTDFEN